MYSVEYIFLVYSIGMIATLFTCMAFNKVFRLSFCVILWPLFWLFLVVILGEVVIEELRK